MHCIVHGTSNISFLHQFFEGIHFARVVHVSSPDVKQAYFNSFDKCLFFQMNICNKIKKSSTKIVKYQT